VFTSHALVTAAILAGYFAGLTSLVLLSHPFAIPPERADDETETGAEEIPAAA